MFKQVLTERIFYIQLLDILPDESKDKIMSQFMILNLNCFKLNPFKIYDAMDMMLMRLEKRYIPI